MLTLKNYVAEDTENPGFTAQDEQMFTLVFKEATEFEERETVPWAKRNAAPGSADANKPDVIETKSRFAFEIVDFDYDPDEDSRDWNGLVIYDYPVFFRRDVGKPVEENHPTFKSERSTAYKYLTALGFDVDGGEDIDIQSAYGRRIAANLKAKDSGWPKIENPARMRKRKAKAAPKPAPEDDDEEFWDGDE